MRQCVTVAFEFLYWNFYVIFKFVFVFGEPEVLTFETQVFNWKESKSIIFFKFLRCCITGLFVVIKLLVHYI